MRTKYILLTILSSLVFASCNYLDFDETNNLKTKEDMYKYFGTSKSMLTHVYSYMPQGYRLFATSGGIFTEDIYSMRVHTLRARLTIYKLDEAAEIFPL